MYPCCHIHPIVSVHVYLSVFQQMHRTRHSATIPCHHETLSVFVPLLEQVG